MKVKKKNWQTLEELAAKIYASIESSALVKHNDQILGHLTEKPRQIDVSIRSQVAGHDLLVVVQVRDRARAPDINAVGELAEVMEDVCASKGVIVCRKPPSQHVIRYAKKRRIDFCAVFDVEDRDWANAVLVPVVVTFVQGHITPHLTIRRNASSPPVKYERRKTRFLLSKDNGVSSMDLLEFATQLIANQKITASGEHRIKIDDETLRIEVGGQWLPLTNLLIELHATVVRRFRYCKPEEYSVLRNYTSGRLSIAKLKLQFPGLSATGWEDPDALETSSCVQKDNAPLVDLRLSELAESGGIGFNVFV